MQEENIVIDEQSLQEINKNVKTRCPQVFLKMSYDDCDVVTTMQCMVSWFLCWYQNVFSTCILGPNLISQPWHLKPLDAVVDPRYTLWNSHNVPSLSFCLVSLAAVSCKCRVLDMTHWRRCWRSDNRLVRNSCNWTQVMPTSLEASRTRGCKRITELHTVQIINQSEQSLMSQSNCSKQ